MGEEPARVKLSGGLPKTASWVWFETDGSFKAEFYDFSNEAQNHFGNDVAYTLTVLPLERQHLEWLLLGDSQPHTEGQILHAIASRFASYFDLKAWLTEHAMPFEQVFDSWA